MAKFAITLCVVLFASVANTFIIPKDIYKMLIDMATTIKSMEAQMIKNRGDDNIEKFTKVASDLLSNYYKTVLKTEFIRDTMPCNDVFNDPKMYGTECDLSCIDSLSIYSSAMDNMFTCTSTNFPSLDYYKNEINNSTIMAIVDLMQLQNKTLRNSFSNRIFKPTKSINSFNHELRRWIDSLEKSITTTINAAKRSVIKTVTDCLNEKFQHFRNELTKQIDKVKKYQTNSTKSLNEVISAEVNGTRTELTKLKNNTITEYIAITEEWAKDCNQVANTFIISNNKIETLKDVAIYKTSIKVQMIKNSSDDIIDNLKTVASDLLPNYYETLKTTFINDTMPCKDVLNGPTTNMTECDLSCIDSLFIYSSAMVNMSTCTSTNFQENNYKNEINNSAITTLMALIQSRTKTPDKGLLSRLFKPTNSINSFNHELQRYIDNLEQSITETVNAANRNVSKTVTDCLNEKFKHFRNELRKQIANVNECRTESTKSLNQIINDEVNDARTKLTRLKSHTVTMYKMIIEQWAKDYGGAVFSYGTLAINVKGSGGCKIPFQEASDYLGVLQFFFDECRTIVEDFNSSAIARTHITAFENYITELNKCPIHKSFASIIDDAHSTECVMQARTNSRWEELRSSIGDRRQESFECVFAQLSKLRAVLVDVKSDLGPNCPYEENGQVIYIYDFKWN